MSVKSVVTKLHAISIYRHCRHFQENDPYLMRYDMLWKDKIDGASHMFYVNDLDVSGDGQIEMNVKN